MTSPTVPAPVIIVGYRPFLIDSIEDFLEPPSPPGNITREETLEKWHAEKRPVLWQQMQYTASFCKLTGRINEIFAIDPRGQASFSCVAGGGDDAECVSSQFLRWLRQRGHSLSELCVLGFTAKRFVRVSGVEAALDGERVPLEYWYQGAADRTIDPYEILVESDQRHSLTVQNVLQIAKVPFSADWSPHINPRDDAVLAAKLAYRFDMVQSGDRQKRLFEQLDNFVLEQRSPAATV